MQSVNQPAIPHALLSSGVDWITATAQKGSTRWDMSEYARHERDRLMDAGETIKSGYRLGYYGWEVEGFFHGQREGGSIIIASGAVADRVWRTAYNVADHISRLDLQATVATPTDLPHLGVQAYQALKSGTPSKVQVKNVTLITSHPQGETVTIGKRSSDQYGRVYDKATEAKLGAARSVWRYEVEYKRRPANSIASRLRRSEDHQAATLSLVHEWYNARGVAPIFSPRLTSCPQEPMPYHAKRDVLAWFEQNLSVTVSRAVRQYGLERVLESLGLLKQIALTYERREDDASGLRRSV